MRQFIAAGAEFKRRGWLAPMIEPDAFAACRLYLERIAPAAPYDLLCPAIVRAGPAEAAAIEAAVPATGPEPFAPPRSRPPAALYPAEEPFTAYGYHRLGPIIAAFAGWVGQLPFVGDRPVFGVMRDGGFLAAALRTVRPDLTPGEVWLSRRLCLTGAIRSAEDRDGLLNLLVRARGRPAGVAEAARDLGLDGEPLPDTLDGFLERVTAPAWKEKLEAHCRAVRHAILAHLDSLSVFDRSGMVLVDIGYAGSIQRTLAAILRTENRTVPIHGAYLITSPGLLWLLRDTPDSAAGFLAHLGGPSRLARAFMAGREVFETFCSSPFGPLLGYDGRGRPLLGPVVPPARQLEEIRRLQQGALACCAAGRPPLSRSEARWAALNLLEAPRPEEAARIGAWLYDDPLAIGRPRALTERLDDAERPVLWPGGAGV